MAFTWFFHGFHMVFICRLMVFECFWFGFGLFFFAFRVVSCVETASKSGLSPSARRAERMA